jgi:hypothetical protein
MKRRNRGTAHPYYIRQIKRREKSHATGQTSQHQGKSSQIVGQMIKTWEINTKYKFKMEKTSFIVKSHFPKKKENKHNQQLFPK